MDLAARRYARRILLAHAALLLVVLATVAVAAQSVYRGARDEVLGQAQSRQRLLAQQTAQGIENHYDSILNDMDLMRQSRMAADATGGRASSSSATGMSGVLDRGLAQFLPNLGRNPRAGLTMWKQLQGRASLLFVCDRGVPPGGRSPPQPRLIGSDEPGKLTPEAVMAKSSAWVKEQRTAGVGEFGRWGDVAGNLVCVPLLEELGPPPDGRGGRRPFRQRFDEPTSRPAEPRRLPTTTTGPVVESALVALVPITRVERDFLRPLGDEQTTAAWLVDQRGTAMAASRAALVGADMADLADPSAAAVVGRRVADHAAGCEVIDRPFAVGRARFAASIVAAEPVLVGDRQWELFVATSLESVDGSVGRLFRRAVWWGGGVATAVALILASTAAGLIRSRMRVERLRHEVLTRELAQARQIQLAWLPKALPTAGPIDVAAVNSPASHISGDFYNWFDLPDGRLAVTIGDVTGHGMSAAFLMATTQLLVRTTLARLSDPGACLGEVNRQLCSQAFNEQFVTMLVAVLDPAGRQVAVATAGHPPPLLLAEPGGGTQPLPVEPQLVLGVDCDWTYPTEWHELPPGAALVLYTDGVVECPAGEATPHAGQRFGDDRLRQAVSGVPASPATAQSLVDGIVTAVDVFRGARPLDDDLTIVAVQLRPAGPLVSD